MAIWRISDDGLRPLEETRLAAEGVRERDGLQRLLRENVGVVAPDTLVISEEYGDWTEGRRRIDLLGVDTDANLVVIELKRTETGGHMELQAIRYAAMVSTMTFAKAVATFQFYLGGLGRDDDAESLLLEFLGWDEAEEDAFAQEVRIVLASAEFSKELTTSVIWLNERGLDIRCVRMKPYRLGDALLLDVQQVVPLPEAADYQVQVREKAEEKRLARKSNADFTRFDLHVGGTVYRDQWKRGMILRAVSAAVASGVSPDELEDLLPRGASRFVAVDGVRNADEFLTQFSALRTPRGASYDPRRFFIADGDLIAFQDRTYAFSNQWGGKGVFKALKALAERFPDLDIRWSKSGAVSQGHDEESATVPVGEELQ